MLLPVIRHWHSRKDITNNTNYVVDVLRSIPAVTYVVYPCVAHNVIKIAGRGNTRTAIHNGAAATGDSCMGR